MIKVQNVNQKDERFDDIIYSLWEIINLNDSFLITSIENKIKYILNKKWLLLIDFLLYSHK